MQVVLNGEAKQLPDGATVTTLLASLGLDQRRVAVELNERVVPQAQHAETRLGDGDRLEIVTFVGGG